ncbi:S-adenosylmethionine-dependent methyltransferase [Nocardioides zeae]|uniref:S-adenosylmethionine-dependent methyltransferase n=1 Tax=Nocardioides zeae TaxID=1457234 RepID=A0ACC6IGD2_9ACTN|nr:methyltransferase domain-containing protein [Nocardioides zeae]MDR6176670.1 S-adenosylmethionine-dependent methyltransferase [Nocardioides zeae]MDR6209682.1 S-adenosylmethionine-dependent methyltransferase [Nocardioides zeae]
MRDAIDPLLVDPQMSVVDVGGGTGGHAVRLAGLGHRVVVVDPSPDALASLHRRAVEAGVGDRIEGVQGDLGDLGDVVPAGSVDLLLCHGVLEIVADAREALGALAGVLRPGGHLSLVVAQRYAAVLARAMAGQFVAARELLDDTTVAPSGRAGRRFARAELEELLGAAGLRTVSVHGVRVFADLVPGALLDAEPGSSQALVELERAAAQRPELQPLASQLHVVAQR